MFALNISGGIPLIGSTYLAGSYKSANNIIYAALLSSEPVIIDNVPRTPSIVADLLVMTKLGVSVEWLSATRLSIYGDNITIAEDIWELNFPEFFISILLFKFGKLLLPVSKLPHLDKYQDIFKKLSIEFDYDNEHITIKSSNTTGAVIDVKTRSLEITIFSILSSLYASGETTLTNTSQEAPVEDFVAFCNSMGASVSVKEPGTITIVGNTVFKGGNFSVQPDLDDAVFLAIAAVITNGNITINNVDRSYLTSFVSLLAKLGCKYEFSTDSMHIWAGSEQLAPVDISITKFPGLSSEWESSLAVLLTRVTGTSTISNTLSFEKKDYIKAFNIMGADITSFKPSDLGMPFVSNNPTYDIKKLGEPACVLKISGPSVLRAMNINISDLNSSIGMVLAALVANGISHIQDPFETLLYRESFLHNLEELGARLH